MPKQVSPEQWLTFLEALRKGFSRREAASKAGISRQSVSRFLNDPDHAGRRALRTQRWASEELERLSVGAGSN